jgi:hypothetical protein
MENEVAIKTAARKAIAKMSRLATKDEPDAGVCYQSMLAQLAVAQLALAYPAASLGVCQQDGTQLRFVARDDGLYVYCCADGPQHGWKVA